MSTRTPIRVFGSSLVSQPSSPFRPYIYGGDVPLHKDPDINTPPKVKRTKAACGTPAGYKRHFNEGTEYCRPCRDAAAEKQRQWKAKQ